MTECKACFLAARRQRRARHTAKLVASGVTTLRCSACGTVRDLGQFHRSRNGKLGRGNVCKPCTSAIEKERRARLASDAAYVARKHAHNRKQIVTKYGLTPEEYRAMHDAQGGACAICGKPETARHRRTNVLSELCIDHDHRTQKVRALLCRRCNQGMGHFRDDVRLLQSSIEYLKKHSAAD